MTGLKPCPFCGCEMVLRPTLMCDNKTIRFIPTPKASENHGGLYQQHKRGCALDYASFIGYPTTKKGAKAKWNRRAESEPQEISDRNLKMWHDIYAEEKRREGSDKE